jgi:diamine N-acetyltransferase
MSDVTIRRATPDDADALVRLILELAEYEQLRDEAEPDAESLRDQLQSGRQPHCGALLAETDDGTAVGFALFFRSYSTFLTNFGMHLEDLYVQPEHRGEGIGFALLRRVAQIARELDCERLDWAVLDWNTTAIDFYRQIGAEPLNEWTTMRLTGDQIALLAGEKRSGEPPDA